MSCIYIVYTEDIPWRIYKEYAWYITGISILEWYIHGIYMVYTWYIKSIWTCHPYGLYIPCKNLMGLFRTFFYIYIPVIYHVYHEDEPDICYVFSIFLVPLQQWYFRLIYQPGLRCRTISYHCANCKTSIAATPNKVIVHITFPRTNVNSWIAKRNFQRILD